MRRFLSGSLFYFIGLFVHFVPIQQCHHCSFWNICKDKLFQLTLMSWLFLALSFSIYKHTGISLASSIKIKTLGILIRILLSLNVNLGIIDHYMILSLSIHRYGMLLLSIQVFFNNFQYRSCPILIRFVLSVYVDICCCKLCAVLNRIF